MLDNGQMTRDEFREAMKLHALEIIDEMERQIAAIHTSTSWKATAPMRSLARGIRALLHR
jgi:hypothetical protein